MWKSCFEKQINKYEITNIITAGISQGGKKYADKLL